MRKVKITSEGTAFSTNVFDVKTGKVIEGITDVRFVASVKSKPVCEAQVTILMPKLDVTVDAHIQDLFDEVESHKFVCDGGPLENCLSWRTIKAMIRRRIKEGREEELSNLRSDARDWAKRICASEVAGMNNAITYVNALCNQIDQIEEQMHDQVRARNVVIADLTSDLAEGPGRDMPVTYREHGGMTYAVYGTSSISYVKELEEQIMDMLRDKDRQKQVRIIDALRMISSMKGVDHAKELGTLRAYLQTFQEIAQKALGDDKFSWATRKCSRCGEEKVIVYHEGSKPVCRECREGRSG